MRVVRAFAISLVVALFLVPAAFAQWPTTCVELNDIVEAHLGNEQNVGIYQRVFGDQAEQACQNDHRDDVRSVFAWAMPEVSTPEPEPTQVTPPVSGAPSSTANWSIETGQSGGWNYVGAYTGTGGVLPLGDFGEPAQISVYCWSYDKSIEMYFRFAYVDSALVDHGLDGLQIQWRWNEDTAVQSGRWDRADDWTVRVSSQQIDQIAYGLIHAGTLALRVINDSGGEENAAFRFTSGGSTDHPVRQVFRACGRSV